MPLSHAILGFLSFHPMTGYDLKKRFNQSIGHFWSATQSHIYKALEKLEAEGMVTAEIIPQEGKPNRNQYQITDAGRAELHHWLATPLPVEGPREAWLIQVFFANGLTNAEIANLFEKRIESLRVYLAGCHAAQENIDQSARLVGIKRLSDLWQLTLDYGIHYYENEIKWLEKTLPIVRELPAFSPPKREESVG